MSKSKKTLGFAASINTDDARLNRLVSAFKADIDAIKPTGLELELVGALIECLDQGSAPKRLHYLLGSVVDAYKCVDIITSVRKRMELKAWNSYKLNHSDESRLG